MTRYYLNSRYLMQCSISNQKKHTAAYFSTNGRKTGSDRRALSDGSCKRPSFSPLHSSLPLGETKIVDNMSPYYCLMRNRVQYINLNILEVGVVKDQWVGSPRSLETRALLVASPLYKFLERQCISKDQGIEKI